MQGKIALEEHFAIEATLADSQVFGAHVWGELGPRLTDFQDQRLRLMDASGVEIMILSLNAPAVQAIPETARAIAVPIANPTTSPIQSGAMLRPRTSRITSFACAPNAMRIPTSRVC